MKRLILPGLAGALLSLLCLSGCHEEKACGPCHARIDQKPCCGGASGGAVINQEGPTTEQRADSGNQKPATSPAE